MDSVIQVFVGSGRVVHRAYVGTNPHGVECTILPCGSNLNKGRYGGRSPVTPTDHAVTCRICDSTLAVTTAAAAPVLEDKAVAAARWQAQRVAATQSRIDFFESVVPTAENAEMLAADLAEARAELAIRQQA